MLDMPVFGQVPRGGIVHLNRHELIHRFPLLEIWIELFTELTSPAGLRVVDLSSCRGSYGESIWGRSIWGSSSLALDFGQHMPRSGNRSTLRDDPIRIIERSGPFQERHWLELKGHQCIQNISLSLASGILSRIR
jgi:hypothetical protein